MRQGLDLMTQSIIDATDRNRTLPVARFVPLSETGYEMREHAIWKCAFVTTRFRTAYLVAHVSKEISSAKLFQVELVCRG